LVRAVSTYSTGKHKQIAAGHGGAENTRTSEQFDRTAINIIIFIKRPKMPIKLCKYYDYWLIASFSIG